MSRNGTDPGIGLEHEHDKHCQRCLVVLSDIADAKDQYGDLSGRVRDLETKRARSEGRDEYRDTKARTLAKGGVAVGLGAWIPQIIELIQKLTGG